MNNSRLHAATLDAQKLTMLMTQQPNWLRLVLQKEHDQQAQQGKYVGNTDVFCLGSYLLSPE